MYCVGKFPDEEDCVAVFPETWLKENGQCLWPKKKSSVRKLSKRGDPLDPENSNTCNVVVLGRYGKIFFSSVSSKAVKLYFLLKKFLHIFQYHTKTLNQTWKLPHLRLTWTVLLICQVL